MGGRVDLVMPDGGQVGWYTDWYDDSCCGPQRWESFHIDELLPFPGWPGLPEEPFEPGEEVTVSFGDVLACTERIEVGGPVRVPVAPQPLSAPFPPDFSSCRPVTSRRRWPP